MDSNQKGFSLPSFLIVFVSVLTMNLKIFFHQILLTFCQQDSRKTPKKNPERFSLQNFSAKFSSSRFKVLLNLISFIIQRRKISFFVVVHDATFLCVCCCCKKNINFSAFVLFFRGSRVRYCRISCIFFLITLS